VSTALQQLLGFFRRHPFVIICSVIAILAWVANYFIWQRQKELTASHQTLQRSGEDMLQSLTNHSRITAELATVKEALTYIQEHMIHEGDLPENMGYFYQLETVSRIRLQALNQLSSMPPPPDQSFKTVPFTLRTTGSYRQVLRFLRELETGPRLFRVQTYSLAQGAAAAGGGGGGRSGTETAETGPAQVSLDITIEVLAHP
jgi:Tfp pilus assembly protein PilO